MTALGWVPFLAILTYVTPLLTEFTGFSDHRHQQHDDQRRIRRREDDHDSS